MDSIKEKTISGLLWRFLERCGAQGVSFVVSIILARLLDPVVYGTIALVTVFTAILQVFVDNGIGNSLVQKKDSDQLDFSTVFYFNILLCFFIYTCLYFAAPVIGKFYDRPELNMVVRVLGLSIIISCFKNIQQAYVSKNMLFKKFFFSTLGGTIGAAIVGIFLAYMGVGVWALVAQQLFNQIVDTLILWFTVKWRPTLEFSFFRLKSLFSYGWKLLASGLLHSIYSNLRSLIIGRWYSAEDLAFYSKGQTFPSIVVTNINTSIDSVLLPAMASAQDSRETVKSMTRRSIRMSSYIMWPLMMGLSAIAHPLITMLLTEKWLAAVPFLQLACISFGLEPLQTANLNAIKALGRSDIYFKLEIIKKTIAIGILLIAMRMGVIGIAVSGVIYSFIASAINAFPNRTLLNYSYIEQFKDIIPSFIMATIMAILIYPIQIYIRTSMITIALQIVIGCIVYIVESYLFKCESFFYLSSFLKGRRQCKQKK